jgi:hypothetical protein
LFIVRQVCSSVVVAINFSIGVWVWVAAVKSERQAEARRDALVKIRATTVE